MPLTGDLRRLRGWALHVQSLGKPNGAKQVAIAKAVGAEVRDLLKKQFASGVGPEGPWKRTVRGRPALVSRKLPGDFKTSAVASGVFVSSRIPWLRAHHEGHTFPARHVAGGRELFFNRKGRFRSRQSFEGAQYQARIRMHAIRLKMVGATPAQRRRYQAQLDRLAVSSGFVATQRSHSVRARVLPMRRIYPDDMRRGAWGQAIARGFNKAAAAFVLR